MREYTPDELQRIADAYDLPEFVYEHIEPEDIVEAWKLLLEAGLIPPPEWLEYWDEPPEDESRTS